MNVVQTGRALKAKGIDGFERGDWEFKAPEVIASDEFFRLLTWCRISEADYRANTALFTLFRFKHCFQDRVEGKRVDDWLSGAKFASIAAECCALLEAQPDLTDWQQRLKETFRAMSVQAGQATAESSELERLRAENQALRKALDEALHAQRFWWRQLDEVGVEPLGCDEVARTTVLMHNAGMIVDGPLVPAPFCACLPCRTVRDVELGRFRTVARRAKQEAEKSDAARH